MDCSYFCDEVDCLRVEAARVFPLEDLPPELCVFASTDFPAVSIVDIGSMVDLSVGFFASTFFCILVPIWIAWWMN